MRIGRLGGAALALVAIGVSHEAWANTWNVTCPGSGNTTLQLNGGAATNFGTDAGTSTPLTGTGTGGPDALGALLGTPSQATEPAIFTDFNATLSSGDLVKITGMCEQEIVVRTPGITITGPGGNIAVLASPPSTATIGNNGVIGQFEVQGAQRVVINELLFGTTTGTVAIRTDYPGADSALLYAFEGAQVFLFDSWVQGSPVRGIFANETSTINIESSTVTGNGIGQAILNENGGIEALDDSTISLGVPNTGTNPVTVTGNAGDGVSAFRNSSLSLNGATISDDGQREVYLNGGSGSRIFGSNATPPTVIITANAASTDPAIQVVDASSLAIEAGAFITGGTSTGGVIELDGNSALLLQGAQVSGGATVIQASGGSSVFLAGGNLICNGSIVSNICMPGAGVVMQIDHVSTLMGVEGQLANTNFPAAGDTLFGAGAVVLQSTVDLGTGTPGGQTSITWTTEAGGITVSQNSSFRLEGGVQINGTVNLSQGPNGFFNKSKGGNNNVTAIQCPFTAIPSAHVAGPTAVAPALTLSTNMASTTAKQCLSF